MNACVCLSYIKYLALFCVSGRVQCSVFSAEGNNLISLINSSKRQLSTVIKSLLFANIKNATY